MTYVWNMSESSKLSTSSVRNPHDRKQNADGAEASHSNSGFVPDEVANNSGTTKSGQLKHVANGRMSRGKRICGIFVTISSLLCIILGIAMLSGLYDLMFNSILNSQLTVSKGSRTFDIWSKTPVPMQLKLYIYNLTNPNEFMNGAKPKVHQLGPYVYNEYHEKEDIVFNQNETVSYYQKRWWKFDPLQSHGFEDDLITIVNIVPVSAAYSLRNDPKMLLFLELGMITQGEKLIRKVTAGDLLFYGYDDPFLKPPYNPKPEYTKMAWFYNRNMSKTFDGRVNMFTGADDISNVGKIDWWNGDHSKFFDAPCGDIVGSAGEMFPPHLDKTPITLYNTDLCRSVTLRYFEDRITKDGLSAYRFVAEQSVFAYPNTVPSNVDNLCFCLNSTLENCPKLGLIDGQTCRGGSPALASLPHFLYGDPQLLSDVEGVSLPNEQDHSFYMDFLPEVGVPVSVRARFQINMLIQPYQQISQLKNVKEVVLPMIWFEAHADVTPEIASQLKPLIFLMSTPFMTVVWSVIIALGVTVLILTLVFFKRISRRFKERYVVSTPSSSS